MNYCLWAVICDRVKKELSVQKESQAIISSGSLSSLIQITAVPQRLQFPDEETGKVNDLVSPRENCASACPMGKQNTCCVRTLWTSPPQPLITTIRGEPAQKLGQRLCSGIVSCLKTTPRLSLANRFPCQREKRYSKILKLFQNICLTTTLGYFRNNYSHQSQ